MRGVLSGVGGGLQWLILYVTYGFGFWYFFLLSLYVEFALKTIVYGSSR